MIVSDFDLLYNNIPIVVKRWFFAYVCATTSASERVTYDVVYDGRKNDFPHNATVVVYNKY